MVFFQAQGTLDYWIIGWIYKRTSGYLHLNWHRQLMHQHVASAGTRLLQIPSTSSQIEIFMGPTWSPTGPTPFWLCSHYRIIIKFSGVITRYQGKVHAKGQDQRSKVKVTEVTTQLNRFRTVTPGWIHIWWWNDTYSLMLLRRGALLFLKVIRQISRSHGSKKRKIWPRLAVSGL